MNRLLPLLFCCALLSSAVPLYANGEGSGSGTVAETILVESYVYVRLEEDGTWLAAAPTPVAVGDKVEYAAGIQMGEFHSTSLNRTFDSIVFVGSLKVASRLADGHALAGDPHAVRNSATAPPPAAGEIPPLEGGRTIGEIHAASAELDDQEVALRARVVKVSEGILGRNWITLQDGTGQAPADKLIATSDHLAEVGEVVAVSGTLRSDVDLGSGYRYGVLLEEASFSR
jgi:hypothetical protein